MQMARTPRTGEAGAGALDSTLGLLKPRWRESGVDIVFEYVHLRGGCLVDHFHALVQERLAGEVLPRRSTL